MKGMRRLLGDRLSGGAIAVAFAYLLLLQGLVAGLSHGAMALPGGDGPATIICSAFGAPAPEGSEIPWQGPAEHPCCTGACPVAGTPGALVTGGIGPVYPAAAAIVAHKPAGEPALHIGAPRLRPGTRAPPVFV